MNDDSEIGTELTCKHCGDVCDVVLEEHDHLFCCEGCLRVYEILEQSGLCDFYELEEQPVGKVISNQTYDYLDHEDVGHKLHTFNEGGIAKVTFFIPKIHCSSCIWLLEHLQRIEDAVLHSEVNFLKKEVYITYNSETYRLSQLAELLQRIGYAPTVTLDDYKNQTRKKSTFQRRLIYQLGVAGFCFGNTMLLSFPEYLSGSGGTGDYQALFNWLNLSFSLPVLLFSSADYFISAWKAIRAKALNIDVPITLGISAMFIRSALEIITNSGTGFMDSFTMLVFLLLIGKWYQNRTYQALSFERDYQSYFPIAVTRVLGDKRVQLPLDQVEVEQVLALKHGELIPADAVLLSEEIAIDYSFVTGESVPVRKCLGDNLFAGGRVIGGSAQVKVTKPVSQSYLTRLWNERTFKSERRSLKSLSNRVSERFLLVVGVIALATLTYYLLTNPSMAWNTFTAVLIVACPCALALSVPFSFGTAMKYLGRVGIYLKSADVIEQLAQLDVLVFDKTGTLTIGKGAVVCWVGEHELSTAEEHLVKGLVHQSGHPLSQLLDQHLNVEVCQPSSFDAYVGKGLSGVVYGKTVLVGSAAFVGANKLEQNGTAVWVKVDGTLLGYFAFSKEYRSGLEPLLRGLGKDYDLHLLSGDQPTDEAFLATPFKSRANLHFSQTPASKLAFIESLQASGKRVMMVGDGLNDAGALKQADVGVSVADDVYQFTPASDVILDSHVFNSMSNLLRFSRQVVRIVKASFILSLTYNVLGIAAAIMGYVTPLFAAVLMPVSSVTVVSFVTLFVSYRARKNQFFSTLRKN